LPLKKTKESVTGHLQGTHGCQLWACSGPTCEQQQEKKERKHSRIIIRSKAKKCKCGSTEHSRITHKFCPLNKRKKNSTPEIETNCDSISVTSKQNIQNMVSTMCLLQEADVSSNSEDSDNDTYRN
jgi:hypothetical protein